METGNTGKNYSDAVKNMITANYSEKSTELMFYAETELNDSIDYAQKYKGMTYDQKQQAMIDECNEIAAENDVYDYYND